MDLAPPPAPALDPPSRDGLGPPAPVIGGVAAMLAARLEVDAIWIRIAFVLLALVGGLGVLVYGAMWLAFIVGAAPHRRWARITGGVVLVAGLPLLLSSGFTFFDGPFAILALLAGLAVALWQPRAAAAPPRWAPPPPDVLAPAGVPSEVVDERARRARATAQPPSILGRLTLGIAVLVAAIGALVDQANGGRLHPEQWLGAAAVACGIGLLAGAFAGRALWLVIPAVAFAATGFVAGEAARIGVEPTSLIGEPSIFIDRDEPGGNSRREHVAMGAVDITIDNAPRSPTSIDARVGIGKVDIEAADDVTVEVRTQVDNGTVEVDGVQRDDGTFTIGPEGTPDVVVTAIVGRGDLEVDRYPSRIVPPDVSVPPIDPGGMRVVADGVALTRSGNVVLAGGEAVIGTDGTVLVGSARRSERVVIVDTSMGEFQLLPGGLLLTPSGELLDLQDVRDGQGG